MNKRFFVFTICISAILAAALSLLLYRAIVKAPRQDAGPVLKAGVLAERPAQTEPEYFVSASNLEKKGDLLKAKEAYQKIIEKFPASNNVQKAEEALDSLNIRILFSPAITQGFLIYEVQKGDTVTMIAKRFNTTKDYIIKANGLTDGIIKVGRKLKLTNTKFSMVVDKSQNILTLKSNDEILKTYKVATGKNSSTPSGAFTVTNKLIDPPWYPPAGGVIPAGDPKNVLGSRWMGISKPGYGIHGTIEPESIGKSVTEGCVRMRNGDVEELYAIVPEGTEVVIVD